MESGAWGACRPTLSRTIRSGGWRKTRRHRHRQHQIGDSGNLPALPIGVYDVTASRAGFGTLHSNGVTVAVGTTTRLDLELTLASVGQEVTVQAQSTVLNTESSEGGVLLGSTQVTNLPLNGRNFLQLVTLQPGVRSNAGAGRISFTFNGAPPQQGINLLVDGTDATGIESAEVGGINRAPGQSTFTLSLDSVSEFVVHSNNFSVRYGRTLRPMFGLPVAGWLALGMKSRT